jgi:hypothetical protein
VSWFPHPTCVSAGRRQHPRDLDLPVALIKDRSATLTGDGSFQGTARQGRPAHRPHSGLAPRAIQVTHDLTKISRKRLHAPSSLDSSSHLVIDEVISRKRTMTP